MTDTCTVEAATEDATVVEADVVDANATVDLCSLLDKQSPLLLVLLAVTVMSGLVLRSLNLLGSDPCTRRTTCVPSRISTNHGCCGRPSE